MKQNIVERKIMWGDLDSLGIVFYPRYYEWIDACGHLFFEHINLNLWGLWHDRNIQFGLAETSCRYIRPGRYHQKIQILTSIDMLEKKTITLRHTIKEAVNGTLMVDGMEKRVCMDVSDPENFRAISIPIDILEVLKKAKCDSD